MKKRIISLSVVIALLLTSLTGRVAYIIFSNDYTVSEGYNSYVLSLEKMYPTIYYSSTEKMTNNKFSYAAVLRPNEKTLADLHNLFPQNEVTSITNELKLGYPIIKEADSGKISNAKYIDIYKTKASSYPSTQLISESSNGLLSYMNAYGERKIKFYIDAKGRMLQGDEGEVYEEYFSNNRGLTISINKDIEKIAYDACKKLKSGCAVIMKVEDSSILACVTKPDSSYINKAFEQYSVGSIFKIIVSVCALENNIDFYYNCDGKTQVGDTAFSCQKNKIHGFVNLKSALADSCNCYFVNLALKLGKDKLLQTAQKLGFGDDITLYNEWKINSANLPTENELNSKGELALFGFGQGKLTSSPLQMCYSLCTIANGGNKNQVHFSISTINENGFSTKYDYKDEERVISKETSDKMLSFLRYVVTNGTGYSAETSAHKSAGKTATAQTGQYINGNEALNTWFAGVYPYDKPEYAIVVMTENGTSGAEDCAPIYSAIVESLEDL